MATYPVLDRLTVLNRLRRPLPHPFFREEEEEHPWRAGYCRRFHAPLLRIWDQVSGSHPDEDGCMSSRAPEMRLDDRESRRTSLSGHLNYSDWTPTPYISFTTCETRIESLAAKRINRRRGAQMITVIDPDTRLRNGLPILDVEAEMDHYKIQDPYGGSDYYNNEYVCLWQVTSAEIVGHWEWDYLVDDENWYQNIILPAFNEFTEKAATGNTKGLLAESGTGQTAKDRVDDLQSIFTNLSITRDPPSCSNLDIVDGGLEDHHGNEWYWNSDDEAIETNIEDNDDQYWDTDDEVEEANRADDIIKLIEGDW
ncbi:hypothetical protein F5B21DRAFT_495283 [Xylaria acuta]|nr:hypothetical protein F5B21DRAFT_495283 [Xylaria acuta]